MLLTELRKRSQVTIPKEIIKQLGLKEGEKLQMSVEKGKIVIKPVVVIAKDEQWIWTKEMQGTIAEGRKDSRGGKLKAYEDIDLMFKENGLDEDLEDSKKDV